MRALIIGGGIAGPVAAMALRKAGWEPAVYEAHAQASEEAGSYLTVASNGIDALRAIGAEAPVLEAGFPTPVNVLLAAGGRRLGVVSNGGRLADGTAAHTIRRARLYAGLHELAASRGIPAEFGKRLASAERTPGGGVVARFTDGTSAAGDVLIGADGVHSATRTLIDPAAPAPRYVGLVNFGGYTPGMAVADPGTWYMIFGKRAFFGYVTDPGGGTVWFANVPRAETSPAERAATTERQWQQQLLELFADDHGPATDLITAGRLEVAGDNTYDLPTVPTWHSDRMVIIGDAAHVPSPSSGQGASLAAEDAVVLAKALRDQPAIGQALAAYESLRRDRVEKIVAEAARASSSKAPGPVGRAVQGIVLPLVFRFLVTDKSLAWRYDYHIDWSDSAPAAKAA
jgi:2-polyprenyl-6-methoxyphenol hydroxylase-like FAD-dependent oxidoreductase